MKTSVTLSLFGAASTALAYGAAPPAGYGPVSQTTNTFATLTLTNKSQGIYPTGVPSLPASGGAPMGYGTYTPIPIPTSTEVTPETPTSTPSVVATNTYTQPAGGNPMYGSSMTASTAPSVVATNTFTQPTGGNPLYGSSVTGPTDEPTTTLTSTNLQTVQLTVTVPPPFTATMTSGVQYITVSMSFTETQTVTIHDCGASTSYETNTAGPVPTNYSPNSQPAASNIVSTPTIVAPSSYSVVTPSSYNVPTLTITPTTSSMNIYPTGTGAPTMYKRGECEDAINACMKTYNACASRAKRSMQSIICKRYKSAECDAIIDRCA